jgi:Fur family ferric uptake transcriptional regulator
VWYDLDRNNYYYQKEHGLASPQECRMTRQRRVILDEVRSAECHPTADEVYQRVRRHLPHVSLGTVYRSLEVLRECGKMRKLELGCAQRRYDGELREHYHVRCVRCGCVADVKMRPVAGIQEAGRGGSNYEVLGYSLEFFGVCPRCGKKARRRRGTRCRARA